MEADAQQQKRWRTSTQPRAAPLRSINTPSLVYIPKDEFTYTAPIGRGGNAVVYKGKYLYDEVAIKQFDVEEGDKDDVASFLQEAKMLSTLGHQHSMFNLASRLFIIA